MLVDFQPKDRPHLDQAIDLGQKAIDAAVKAVQKIGHAALPYEADAESLNSFKERLTEFASRNGDDGLFGTLDVPQQECAIARVGLTLVLQKMSKIESDQIEMTIPDEATKEVISHVQHISDRLNGQASLFEATEVKQKVKSERKRTRVEAGAES